MDAFSFLRTVGALGLVLGLMAGGLWLVRRLGLRLPGAVGGGQRLELVERTAVDARRSVVLIRRDGREHLLLIGPEGATVVESAIIRDALDEEVARARTSEVEQQRAAAEAAMRVTRARAAAAWAGALRGLAGVVSALRQARFPVRADGPADRITGGLHQLLPRSSSFAAVLAQAYGPAGAGGKPRSRPLTPSADSSVQVGRTRARSRRQRRRKRSADAQAAIVASSPQ